MADPDSQLRLADIAVRLVDPRTSEAIGTGVLISRDGHIVTCAHVVKLGGLDPRTGRRLPPAFWKRLAIYLGLLKAPPASAPTLIAYFRTLPDEATRSKRCVLKRALSNYDDDVVLLQLESEQAPFGPERLATLGDDDPYSHASYDGSNTFRTHGDRPAVANGGDGSGTIIGIAEAARGKKLFRQELLLKTSHVDHRMSGAPIYDVKRRLLVGIVARRFDAGPRPTDRDTSFGVPTSVLAEPTFGFTITTPAPPTLPEMHLFPQPQPGRLTSAPPGGNSVLLSLPMLVERPRLRKDILQAFFENKTNVVGLIGGGGFGKTTIAHQVIDQWQVDAGVARPLFWWSFYREPNGDDFISALRDYLEAIYETRISDLSSFVPITDLMLVLDGLEAAQHDHGDLVGIIANGELRRFVVSLTEAGARCHCLLTSRIAPIDMPAGSSYCAIPVGGLTSEEGVELLGRLGISMPPHLLRTTVAFWDGNPLALKIAGLDFRHHQGAIAAFRPDAFTTGDKLLSLIEHCETHWTERTRTFVALAAAFRRPTTVDSLISILGASRDNLVAKNDDLRPAVMSELTLLTRAGLVQYDAPTQLLSFHPGVHRCLRPLLDALKAALPDVVAAHHLAIARAYQSSLDLDNLTPSNMSDVTNAVHHLAQAGAYQRAWEFFWDDVCRGDRHRPIYEFGAYDACRRCVRELFSGRSFDGEPQLTSATDRRTVIAIAALCFQMTGYLAEAKALYERKNRMAADPASKDPDSLDSLATGKRMLADIFLLRGEFSESLLAANDALQIARMRSNKRGMIVALVSKAWCYRLKGDPQRCAALFKRVRTLTQKEQLLGFAGIRYASHLIELAQFGRAATLTQANVAYCATRYRYNISHCERLLGDIAVAGSLLDVARDHYNRAVSLARRMSHREALIQALIARGRLRQHLKEVGGRADLDEALGASVSGGYLTYEVDVRTILIEGYILRGKSRAAFDQHLEYARRICQRIDYGLGVEALERTVSVLDGRLEEL